jgi:hypothetical protein
LKGIKFHGIISLLAWQAISDGCELQPTPPNDEGHEMPLDLNLTQLAKHEKLVGRKMHPQLKFEHITKPWH